MSYGASKSDIDYDIDDSGSDVSIATDASSSQFNHATRGGCDDEEDLELLREIGGNDDDYNSVSGSDASINSDTDPPVDMGDEKRCRLSSVDSDDFGPPIVVPLKPEEPIESGSRSSRGSRRSTRTAARSGSFNRRAPVRTKSGEMTGSSHSTASDFRRRPPVRTKSGEACVANGVDDDGRGSHRRRPPRRTKSGEHDGIRRRPPPRTKSGSTMRSNHDVGNEAELEDYVADMPGDDSGEEGDAPLSPNSSKGSEHRKIARDIALTRNMARRQRSSDTLGAMREATRNVPGRSKSMAGPGISNGRRRNPGRAKSSDMAMDDLASPGRKPLRRKAPPRTKSGGSLSRPPL